MSDDDIAVVGDQNPLPESDTPDVLQEGTLSRILSRNPDIVEPVDERQVELSIDAEPAKPDRLEIDLPDNTTQDALTDLDDGMVILKKRLYARTLPEVLGSPIILSRGEEFAARHFRYQPEYISRINAIKLTYRVSNRRTVELACAMLGFAILAHEYNSQRRACTKGLVANHISAQSTEISVRLETEGYRIFPYKQDIRTSPDPDVYVRQREARPELPINSMWTPMGEMSTAFGFSLSDIWHISLAKAFLTDPATPVPFKALFEKDCGNFHRLVLKRQRALLLT